MEAPLLSRADGIAHTEDSVARAVFTLWIALEGVPMSYAYPPAPGPQRSGISKLVVGLIAGSVGLGVGLFFGVIVGVIGAGATAAEDTAAQAMPQSEIDALVDEQVAVVVEEQVQDQVDGEVESALADAAADFRQELKLQKQEAAKALEQVRRTMVSAREAAVKRAVAQTRAAERARAASAPIAPAPAASGGGGTDPRFSYCYEANDAGYGPYHQGEPEYLWYDDADGDGVVCES